MKFELPVLLYALDALAPKISKQTMELHYGKHLQAYVTNLNNLIVGSKFERSDLNTIVMESDGAIFNNAGQTFNHNIYFATFSPTPQSEPTGALAEAIKKNFGSFGEFKEQFSKSALTLFGSGWAWLSKKDDGSLIITQESNAGNPLRSKNGTALLGCDVWEHAYYLDYQNRRADHIQSFWDVIDWKTIEQRFK